jgi:hypothetical protein
MADPDAGARLTGLRDEALLGIKILLHFLLAKPWPGGA